MRDVRAGPRTAGIVNVGAGIVLVVSGSLLGAAAFGLWRRTPKGAAVVAAAASGTIVGVGALLVQAEASAADWVITLVALCVLAPVHARVVFGPPGRAR